MQKETQNHQENSVIYSLASGYIPKHIIEKRNSKKQWKFGYNDEFDVIVISKNGQIGDIYIIDGLYIAIPKEPDEIYYRSLKKSEQYWQRKDPPEELARIKSIQQWNESPVAFKSKWTPYIDVQFDYREHGFWFMNNGEPTYITGFHWFYLQIASIDVGYPDFREANRIKYIHWEACMADDRCFGQLYVKIRRSGHSFETSSDAILIGISTRDRQIGLLSKTVDDVKGMFTKKVVPINTKLPFYFKPMMEGMDKPKTVLSYATPATKITKNNVYTVGDVDSEGLNTSISYRSSDDNAYDGEKLVFLSIDEAGKFIKPANLTNMWRVHKTCLRLGSKIIGKCKMGSTVNAQKKGGAEFKKMYEDSQVTKRNANGQTKSGLYSLFIPMEWNMEGFIDIYGMPVFTTPVKPVMGIDGRLIKQGAVDYWNAEVSSLKNDPDALNEFYRQFPRTISHAFRDESKASLFNLTKIYQQIDFNDSLIIDQHLTRGQFTWKDGVKDTTVVWTPDPRGRFLVGWLPKRELQNKFHKKGDLFYPLNEHIGAFGCDPYDISGVVGGGGSKGALSGKTKFHMEEAPTNRFFLQYISRPPTAEIFFEDVLMACVFYGMPALIENNKPRLLYHFKNRGYRPFAMNRPDKHRNQLSKTEIEIGGIPNNSPDVIHAHAGAIETYIEKYVGYDMEGTYRDPQDIGDMLFNETLLDWSGFDITERGDYDASIASGLAIMANQKTQYTPESKPKPLSINISRFSNEGNISRLLKK